MDIRCPKCGNAWEIDSLHDRIDALHDFTSENRPRGDAYQVYYRQMQKDFRRLGCEALGERCSSCSAHPAIRALMDMNGEDFDGLACELEDAQLSGIFDEDMDDDDFDGLI